ncbi:hypothetical protein B566_EDAN001617 [Ephemera danica]|nr:hypothetical protein B566_EDAN001617 [Ephemera danica]
MLYVYGVCIFVSVIFLVLTLVVYTVLPELRDLQGHCLMANVASLALGYTGLAIIQLQTFFIYFWLLSAFFWLNVVSFNVWRGVMMQGRGRRLVRETRLFGFYCAYAWGVPCCFLAASLATHFAPGHLELLRPNFARHETWAYFYGPVAVLLFCNVVFFASTAYTLWSSRSDDIQRIRSHRFKNIMDILNALQGILIFVIMVIRKRTMRAIASRKWGAALCPKSHQLLTGGVDEEESEPVIAEEVELARPNMSTIVVTA